MNNITITINALLTYLIVTINALLLLTHLIVVTRDLKTPFIKLTLCLKQKVSFCLLLTN